MIRLLIVLTLKYPSPRPSPTRGEGTFPPLMGGIKGGKNIFHEHELKFALLPPTCKEGFYVCGFAVLFLTDVSSFLGDCFLYHQSK